MSDTALQIAMDVKTTENRHSNEFRESIKVLFSKTERISVIEEKISLLFDKLNEHVVSCYEHWKKDDLLLERLIIIETLIGQINIVKINKEISALESRVSFFEKTGTSLWTVMSPVISSLLAGGLVWLITK